MTNVGNQKITVVNSLNHSPHGESLTLPGLGDALAKIGVPAHQLAALDLSRTAFSVFGIPGLVAGQAYSATKSLDAEANEAAGSATEASVNGTLALDNHAMFTLNPQGYVLYDIAATGAIVLGGHTYAVPAQPAGFSGGFHVLVVDRRTLEPVSNKLYSTNNNPSEQYRMGTDLAQLGRGRRRPCRRRRKASTITQRSRPLVAASRTITGRCRRAVTCRPASR